MLRSFTYALCSLTVVIHLVYAQTTTSVGTNDQVDPNAEWHVFTAPRYVVSYADATIRRLQPLPDQRPDPGMRSGLTASCA